MVFGSLAKGYKAGGYNSVEVGSQFDNEDVWNLEGGVKSLFADLGLIVNASAFYYEYIRQAGDLAGHRRRRLGRPAVRRRHQRRGSLRPRRRGALAAARRADALRPTSRASTRPTRRRRRRRERHVDLSGEPTGEPYFSARARRELRLDAGHGTACSTCRRCTPIAASRAAMPIRSSRAPARSARTSASARPRNRTDLRLAWSAPTIAGAWRRS